MADDVVQRVVSVLVLMCMSLTLNGCVETFHEHEPYDLNVRMSYKCVFLMHVSGGLTCAEWIQEGGILAPYCFPANATVSTRSGTKTMSELNLGEDILGLDDETGVPVFSPVRAWLHRDSGIEVNMASVRSGSGTLVVSSRHSIAVRDEDVCELAACNIYKFAGELEPGRDSLVMKDGFANVLEVSHTLATGLFAPLTKTSNFFVGGPGEEPWALAHSFAQLKQPRRYEAAFHRLLDVAEFIWPPMNDFENEGYVHPIARMLMRIAGIPITQEMPEIIYGTGWRLSSARRRLSSARRLSSEQEDKNREREVLLLSVVQTMPPFIRHGIIPNGTSGFSAGMQLPAPKVTVEQWLN
jgi:hypothetical protein